MVFFITNLFNVNTWDFCIGGLSLTHGYKMYTFYTVNSFIGGWVNIVYESDQAKTFKKIEALTLISLFQCRLCSWYHSNLVQFLHKNPTTYFLQAKEKNQVGHSTPSPPEFFTFGKKPVHGVTRSELQWGFVRWYSFCQTNIFLGHLLERLNK